MALIAHIVKKSLKDVGVYCSESDTVPADLYNPALEMLRDIIAELNSQTAIQFEQRNITINVAGNKLTFKEYTEAELAIIAGGGTVDITDRIVDFVPITNPIVFKDGQHLDYMSYRDLLDRQDCTYVSSYAFNIGSNYSELIFNVGVAGELNVLCNVPITMDDEPYGEVHIPDAYVHYIVTRLSESVAIRYQFTDTASIFAQKSERTGEILANNAVSRKVVVKRNLIAGLNRYRRYG